MSLLLLLPNCSCCQYTGGRKLVVTTNDCPPFSIGSGPESMTGITIWLWKEIAKAINCEYIDIEEKEWVASFDDLKSENPQTDVFLSCVTITAERAESGIEFSHPYFQGKMGIMLRRQNSFTFEAWIPVLVRLVAVLLGATSILLLVAHVFYFVELRHSQGYFTGVWNAVWWTTVTATSVGYGDLVPITRLGKIIGVGWMLTTLCVMSYFTATLTSLITLEAMDTPSKEINSIHNLRAHRVGVEEGTVGERLLSDAGVATVHYKDATHGMQAVENEEIFAYVTDAPLMQYLVSRNPKKSSNPLTVVEDTVYPPYYLGLAFPKNTNLTEPVNQALLTVQKSGRLHSLINSWTGTGEFADDSRDMFSDTTQNIFLYTCGTILILYIVTLIFLRIFFSRPSMRSGTSFAFPARNTNESLQPLTPVTTTTLTSHGGVRKNILEKQQQQQENRDATKRPRLSELIHSHTNEIRRASQALNDNRKWLTSAQSMSSEKIGEDSDEDATLGTKTPTKGVGSPTNLMPDSPFTGDLHPDSAVPRAFSHASGLGLSRENSLSMIIHKSRTRLHSHNIMASKSSNRVSGISHVRIPESKLDDMQNGLTELAEQVEVVLGALEYLLECDTTNEMMAAVETMQSIQDGADELTATSPQPINPLNRWESVPDLTAQQVHESPHSTVEYIAQTPTPDSTTTMLKSPTIKVQEEEQDLLLSQDSD